MQCLDCLALAQDGRCARQQRVPRRVRVVEPPTRGQGARRVWTDRAGRLWKRAEYQGTVFEGTPVVIRITMEDLQSLTRSELVMSRVRFGDAKDDVLFDRAYLERAKAHLLEALASPDAQGTAGQP